MTLTLEALSTSTPEEILQSVAARNNALFWNWSPSQLGQPVAHWEDCWAADPGTFNPFPNSATLLRPIVDHEAHDLVNRLHSFFGGQAGGPFLLWSAWPTPDLSRLGLQLVGSPPLMIRWPWEASERRQPAELSIRQVSTPHEVSDWLDVLIKGYPAPELALPGSPLLYDERVLSNVFRLFVGYVNGVAVSCSASYADDVVIGVFAVATLPEARGCGYGAALTEASICDRALPAMLTSSDLGNPVYRSLGFRERFRFQLWAGSRSRPTFDR